MLTAREEVRNRGPALDAVAIAGVTLAVIFVVLRWGCRISRRALGWDDYMVTIAAVSLPPPKVAGHAFPADPLGLCHRPNGHGGWRYESSRNPSSPVTVFLAC